jgi:hypothetical protein
VLRRLGCVASSSVLEAVTFERGSRLKSIGMAAFGGTVITRLELPAGCRGDSLLECDLHSFSFSCDHDLGLPKEFWKGMLSCTSIAWVKIPSTVERISDGCFAQCTRLVEVEFENNSRLRSIGPGAFTETNLTLITIPRSVEVIERGCFGWCASLREVKFESGSALREIGKRAFERSGIERICVPSKTVVIGE